MRLAIEKPPCNGKKKLNLKNKFAGIVCGLNDAHEIPFSASS